MSCRIFFENNPWPNGHRLDTSVWDGRLQTDGSLWFDLHLETADYDEDDPSEEEPDVGEEDEEETSWTSKLVWTNYGSCTLSSTQWHFGGWQVADPQKPFTWANWQQKLVQLDTFETEIPEDQDYGERCFHIYLLGHDAVANHQILFKAQSEGLWEIDWSGKIALAYAGDYALDYSFKALLVGMKFSGFNIPQEMSDAQALALFVEAVSNPDQWQLSEFEEGRRFVPK